MLQNEFLETKDPSPRLAGYAIVNMSARSLMSPITGTNEDEAGIGACAVSHSAGHVSCLYKGSIFCSNGRGICWRLQAFCQRLEAFAHPNRG